MADVIDVQMYEGIYSGNLISWQICQSVFEINRELLMLQRGVLSEHEQPRMHPHVKFGFDT